MNRDTPVFAIAANATDLQGLVYADQLLVAGALCGLRFPIGGLIAIFGGPNDLVVMDDSARARGLGSGVVSFTVAGRTHSLSVGRPDIFGVIDGFTLVDGGVVSDLIKNAINTQIYYFGRM